MSEEIDGILKSFDDSSVPVAKEPSQAQEIKEVKPSSEAEEIQAEKLHLWNSDKITLKNNQRHCRLLLHW